MTAYRDAHDPLDGLDTVRWDDLHHAYGEARNVPDLLRALTTDEHESALHELFGNIWHQGTVYEATAHAVPFLFALAAHPSTRDRSGVLSLLGAIAVGTGYHEVHGRGTMADVQLERRWVDAAHAAVARGLGALSSLLDDGDPLVRAAAAHVLGHIRDSKDEIAIRLCRAIARESDRLARSGMLLSLSGLGLASDDVTATLRRVLDSDGYTDGERLAAALAAAHTLGSKVSAEVVELLAEACCDPEGWEESFSGLPWDWSADHRPGDALGVCGDAGRAAIPALCTAVRTTDAISASCILDDLLALAFPTGFSGELDDDGVAVVCALVEAEHLWEVPGQFVSALIQAGLWGGPLDPRAGAAIRKHLRGLLQRNRPH